MNTCKQFGTIILLFSIFPKSIGLNQTCNHLHNTVVCALLSYGVLCNSILECVTYDFGRFVLLVETD